MTTTDRPDLDAIAAREQAASAEVHRLCNGGRWEMRVPARDDADSDLVISRSLSDIDVLLAEVRRLRAELADAEYGAQRALTQILESRELRRQASDYITELKRELETARREERERCADALWPYIEASADLGDGRAVTTLNEIQEAIRALPDATPTTEETPVPAGMPDYIEIAYSRITRVWGVTCTTCHHQMRNAGTTEDAAADLARMHLNHHHRGWDKPRTTEET